MSIRRLLSVLLAMMLFSSVASAQMVKASFGVTGGGIATMMQTDPAPSAPMYMSGYGGAFTTINFGTAAGIRAGANYAMQGGTYEMSNAAVNVAQSYLNVPVAFMLHLKSFLSLEVGMYQNILLSSSFAESGRQDLTISPDEGALKYNFGALAGISINFGRAIFLNVRYNYGLSKSYVIYGVGYPSSFITAGLGFNLVTTKKTAF